MMRIAGKSVEEFSNIVRRSAILLLAVLGLLTEARAQFVWELNHPMRDTQFEYLFDDVSCFKDDCTAGALIRPVPYNPSDSYKQVLFRTKDGGRTWEMQDPQLPPICCVDQYQLRIVQQIDSLNIVGIGDSGLVIRSFDAGVTWERQVAPTQHRLATVHFADLLNGIITSKSDTAGGGIILTTTDGGKNWSQVVYPFDYIGNGFIASQCFGSGMYAVMPLGYTAPIYLTKDNWSNVKKLEVVNEGLDSLFRPYLVGFKFKGTHQDTILTYGAYWGPRDTFNFTQNGLIRRSVDAGQTWEKPHILPEGKVGEYVPMWTIPYVAGFNRDTLIACGIPSNSIYHVSTDFGRTWKKDTITASDTNTFGQKVLPDWCRGLSWSKNHPIAIYGDPVGASYIIVGHHNQSKIEIATTLNYTQRIYPNPTSDILYIASVEASTPFHIKDMLGRTVIEGMVGNRTDIAVDVSALSSGVYLVFVDDLRDGRPILVGKASIVKK